MTAPKCPKHGTALVDDGGRLYCVPAMGPGHRNHYVDIERGESLPDVPPLKADRRSAKKPRKARMRFGEEAPVAKALARAEVEAAEAGLARRRAAAREPQAPRRVDIIELLALIEDWQQALNRFLDRRLDQ